MKVKLTTAIHSDESLPQIYETIRNIQCFSILFFFLFSWFRFDDRRIKGLSGQTEIECYHNIRVKGTGQKQSMSNTRTIYRPQALGSCLTLKVGHNQSLV